MRSELKLATYCSVSVHCSVRRFFGHTNEIKREYWSQLVHHRLYFDKLGKHLGIKHWEDWYDVRLNHLYPFGGRFLLKQFNSVHLIGILCLVYPEHPWNLWNVYKKPFGFWDSEVTIRTYLEQLAEKLHIKHWEDWYRVAMADFQASGGRGLLSKYHDNSLELLRVVYPEHPWDLELQKKPNGQISSRTEGRLFNIVDSLFSGVFIKYIHPTAIRAKVADRQRHIEFDIFVPSKNLAFEYQGQQHYDNNAMFTNTFAQTTLDDEKKAIALKEGIDVIEVPYWWDGTKGSLVATIRKIRPDLLAEYATEEAVPIPDRPQNRPASRSLPGPLLLASSYFYDRRRVTDGSEDDQKIETETGESTK
eukprot:TRINITY_DN25212_c0_g1_i1.p1 TRINITY_DN25212_c0_g1~~TRINITY_DN25212_c0_g1_i1.p1  ORF type:complete len:362 (+),score=57.95 TRINITY_DN25212_c0_g1_i1:64-1149(+)